jgi:hypothetical protein
MKNLIVSGISVEKKLETAYNQLYESKKVVWNWSQYINEVANICVQQNGDTNDAIDMIEKFLNQNAIEE